MDPNLFAVDWERAFEVFVAIVLASFLMERALSVIFENRLFIQKAKDKGLKEPAKSDKKESPVSKKIPKAKTKTKKKL